MVETDIPLAELQHHGVGGVERERDQAHGLGGILDFTDKPGARTVLDRAGGLDQEVAEQGSARLVLDVIDAAEHLG